MRRPLMLLATLLTLAGCGLKDDLYLPPPKAPVAAPATATPQDEGEDDDRAPGSASAPAGATAAPPASP